MNGPLHVCFAIPALDKGGPDRVFYELIRGFDRSRIEPSLVVQRRDGEYIGQLDSSIKIEVVGSQIETGSGYPVLPLRRYIQRNSIDVIVSTLRMTLTATAALVGIPRAPLHIVRPANHLSANAKELIAESPIKHRISLWANLGMLRLSDSVICQSKSLRDDLDRLAGVGHKSFTVGNPIDIDKTREMAGLDNPTLVGNPKILTVGRLMPQKGFDLLINALPAVILSYPEAHLTIVGEGPARQELMQLVNNLGLNSHVTFWGFCNNPYPLMQHCSLFVSASRYEGFPNAVLEALALGRKVVATDCPGGTSELVKQGQTGWLVAAESALELSTGMLAALRDSTDHEPLKLEAFCRENFSTQEIVNAYQAAIWETWQRHRNPMNVANSLSSFH